MSKKNENKKIKKTDPVTIELYVELETRVANLEKMFAAILQLQNPVSQPKGTRAAQYRSGQWHMRGGNVYQSVAEPGSPNAEEANSAATPEATDDQGRHLPPTE